MIGAVFMGLAGALGAHYFNYFSPGAIEPLLIAFLAWVMLIAGGSGDNRGAVAGALPPEWATRSSYVRMLLVGLFLQLVLQRHRAGLFPERPPRPRL